ncbi:hypothetical protein CAPTEDRAFT_201626 [Capitella teleta]|uniref:Retrotransposon gag domain-containing protein n=1 Tax=Capitella teleta TaxID=283909 RepID=R7V153_CAPTE|nr:hypothetical protein CAPTEDRAFT_201626 [Capitella teleta]|eukprot:ELU12578.1 hypothetical protein CAPTEDRAFT_201626 [Capitella teleta]
MILNFKKLHLKSGFRKRCMRGIYSANFKRTTYITIEISAFEKVIIAISQDYARTLRRYFKDLALVGVEQRIDVFRQTASGPLRWECERHLTDHPLLGWDEIEDHLLKAFISTDHQDRLKEGLRRVRQKTHETMLSYNRRFREMARDAFPFPRNQEQERELITLYGKGLAKNEVAKKLASRGWPQDLEAALRATETMEARHLTESLLPPENLTILRTHVPCIKLFYEYLYRHLYITRSFILNGSS